MMFCGYIQGSFWKLNLTLYHEVLRLDSLFRENGMKFKYGLQSIECSALDGQRFDLGREV